MNVNKLIYWRRMLLSLFMLLLSASVRSDKGLYLAFLPTQNKRKNRWTFSHDKALVLELDIPKKLR